MTSPLTAFPADGYTARWRTWNNDASETLSLRWENEGWTATGEVGREAVTYVIRLSATWQVRQFLLFRDLDEPDLWLGTDGAGRWGEMNGAHRTDLDGCAELHLPCTPFTHTLPIRRLQLDVGDSADVIAASVDVETLGVVPARHRYRRILPHRYEFTELDRRSDDTATDDTATDDTAAGETTITVTAAGQPIESTFDTDGYGLVHDQLGRFRRT